MDQIRYKSLQNPKDYKSFCYLGYFNTCTYSQSQLYIIYEEKGHKNITYTCKGYASIILINNLIVYHHVIEPLDILTTFVITSYLTQTPLITCRVLYDYYPYF